MAGYHFREDFRLDHAQRAKQDLGDYLPPVGPGCSAVRSVNEQPGNHLVVREGRRKQAEKMKKSEGARIVRGARVKERRGKWRRRIAWRKLAWWGLKNMVKGLKWVMGWFLRITITSVETTRDRLQRTLKIGGGFNLYGSEGPSGPRVEELREFIMGRIRERQKEPKMSDIEGHEIIGNKLEKRKRLGRRKG